MEYLIEAFEHGLWHIVGSHRMSHIAQGYMRDYRHTHPTTPFRVVENSSGRIVTMTSDPYTTFLPAA